ncbi:VOC family protein [Ramlibacter terrae]|uniref:VOC family protein n=1 Tax=Ramlibacter terrae TaxID=2732511 RepID=A0ABX6P7P4_9BURK|nr:VOC family protein [Ramlibacter terrae]
MLNHAAWITPDAAATTAFYTRIMGMELASTVLDDSVPSTGHPIPYFHIFFRMRDGSTLAFFEAPGVPPAGPATHPAHGIFNHIALQAGDRDEVLQWHEWLTSNGVEVVGPTDHKGLILSIYFHDPAGIRLEITTPLDPHWNQHTEQGYADLEAVGGLQGQGPAEGKDVPTELTRMIKAVRQRYAEGGGAS